MCGKRKKETYRAEVLPDKVPANAYYKTTGGVPHTSAKKRDTDLRIKVKAIPHNCYDTHYRAAIL